MPAEPIPFKVADLSLAEFGRKEITLAEHEMPGLMAVRAEYARTPGSVSTFRPNAREAGLTSYRRSIRSACATAARSSSSNWRWPRGNPDGSRPVAGVVPRTGGRRPSTSRYRSIRGDVPSR